MSTTIEHDIFHQIRRHLEAAYPHEACGFLFGTEQEGKRHVTQIFSVENRSTENLRRRFVIDPLDYLKAEKTAAKENRVLLGIYHSHPDHPAIPSAHDLEYAQPYFSYFIHAVHNGVLTDTRSYRLSGEGDFAKEELLLYDRFLIGTVLRRFRFWAFSAQRLRKFRFYGYSILKC